MFLYHRVWPWSWPWPWIFKVKYRIGYISVKMVRLPRNEKQTYRLISRPQMWPSGLTLAMTLTLNFQGQMRNWLYLPKMVWLPQNEKQTHQLNSRRQMWPSDLTFAMTFAILIWTLGLKCDNGFDLGRHMTLIFEFSRSYVILTIWWPRSGVMIYQIVTGVTSDVGVPSTHLVTVFFSSTLSRDFQPLIVISDNLENDLRCFCEVITVKNIVEEIESIMGYRPWFLEYNLTRVNSVLHRRPWWILYCLQWNCKTTWLQPIHIMWYVL